ncbi:MAG: Na/Pi cotransporter family protein [Bacteroidales bacterium]|jgi:phosphate:Na+ symporter|nr:Na/Pi cotransporter family protein [Bacteroidales bacterium]
MVLQIFTLIGALGMFLYGMNFMSAGLQKASGDKLRGILTSMTSNPFKRVLTGLGITALVQSSSATTVLVVSFVNAGLLTLVQAVGIIMGANIGTTLTAWVTAVGFSVDISAFSVPLMILGFLLTSSKKQNNKNIGEFIVGFALMFLGLSFMKSSAGAILSNKDAMVAFFSHFTEFGFWSDIIFLLAGTILTIVLQASSATMAITMLLTTSGLIDFELACAMVLGENIGTTITANMAASVGNTAAKRAALAHTLFNIFGVIWMLIVFKPFLRLVGVVMDAVGFYNPLTIDLTTPEAGPTLLYGISMLHTLFNITNTMILIWFSSTIVKIVEKLIKTPKNTEEEAFRLKYIDAGRIAAPEFASEQATKEIIHFAQICRNGLGYAREAINETDPDKFEELRKKLVKYEEISDRIEYEIATFLNAISAQEVSMATSYQIKSMYKIIGELESLGDSGESISRILSRKNIHKKEFDAESIKHLNGMVDLVDEAYAVMIENLNAYYSGSLDEIRNAYDAEDRINVMRNNLREQAIEEVEGGDSTSYLTSVYYLDIVSELEKMGDFMINVSQDLYKCKLKISQL